MATGMAAPARATLGLVLRVRDGINFLKKLQPKDKPQSI